MDHAGLRRAYLEFFGLVAGGDLFLEHLGIFGADIGELLGDVGAKILVDLQDLQLGFGYLALGFGHRGRQLAAFAQQFSSVALQGAEAGQLHQPLIPQLLHPHQFLVDQCGFLLRGGQLVAHAADLFFQLCDLLA